MQGSRSGQIVGAAGGLVRSLPRSLKATGPPRTIRPKWSCAFHSARGHQNVHGEVNLAATAGPAGATLAGRPTGTASFATGTSRSGLPGTARGPTTSATATSATIGAAAGATMGASRTTAGGPGVTRFTNRSGVSAR